MELGLVIIAITLVIYIPILFFALYRNNWVLRERLKMIKSNLDKYKMLPSYNEMLWGDKFWKFDINIYFKEK